MPITTCQITENSYACEGDMRGFTIQYDYQKGQFIKDVLLPAGLFGIEAAIVIFVVASAFTIVYHHVQHWRHSWWLDSAEEEDTK